MTDECIDIKKSITQELTNGGSTGSGNDTPDASLTADEKASGSVGGGEVAAGYRKYTAPMPTERYATDYNMNHKNRGRALIFNHEIFEIPDKDPRTGTKRDCEMLSEALQLLGFTVEVHNDCKLREIFKQIEKTASRDHSDNDCILIAILTHGENGYLYATDAQYKLDSICQYFTAHNCPTLAGKPKLFFVQACQGKGVDPGILLVRNNTETDGDSTTSYTIPVYADFLIAYSTMPGFVAWRNDIDGTWFIQSLVKELNANGKNYDILTLLTFVNQHVAFDYESYVPQKAMMHQCKQIPCVSTMLTRLLRFKDKNDKGA